MSFPHKDTSILFCTLHCYILVSIANYWITMWIRTLFTCEFIYFSKFINYIATIVRFLQNTLLLPAIVTPARSVVLKLLKTHTYITQIHTHITQTYSYS